MQLLPEGVLAYLIGGEYNGHRKCIRLIFYEPKENKLYDWYGDKSGHYPYCYTNLSPIELEKIELIKKHPNLIRKLELENKYNALEDKMVWVTKIIVNDPKSIGGGKKDTSVRDIIPAADYDGTTKVWETKIPYDCCYIYDNEFEVGMPYILYHNELILQSEVQTNISNVAKKLDLDDKSDECKTRSRRWISLCEYPVPNFLRVALDIEVLGESKTKVPDTNKADYPIVAVSFVGSDGTNKVLILLRDGVEVGEEDANTAIEFFNEEVDLIQAVFNEIAKYPFIITFNGDNFDLPYIRNRALKLGFEDTPILISRHKTKIKNAIHIDLYRFFFNKSIKTYAFGGKYEYISLDCISKALIGEGKLIPDGDMSEWSYTQLAKYNSQDGKITLKLTTYDDGLVMKLMLVLSRIATMSLEELIRFPISQWIRSVMFYQHRKRNMLIPNREDLIELKGQTSTKAMVKGKKFKGATVIKPVAGVHFKTKVMDYASLYPTVFKVRNLGYATVRCPHGLIWQSLDNDMKKLINNRLHNCKYGCERKCPVQEYIQMMREENELEFIPENGIDNSKMTQRDIKNISKNRLLKQGNGVEKIQRDISEIDEKKPFVSENEIKKNGNDFIEKGEINVKIAERKIEELLKSTILTKSQQKEKLISFLKKIGTNCDYCVPIVTELYTAQKCWKNKIPETSHWVCTKNKAIESETIGLLKDLRILHYKKLKKQNSWYKVIEQAIKVILNATYGVYGDEKFDLYCPPVAEATTAYGRSSIKLAIEKAQDLGIKVLYGDTDSIFLDNPSEEQIEKLSKWSIDTLELDLEVDKTYRYVCLSSRKKNYLGVFEDGKVDVKGMTGKKKHTPTIIKDAFNVTKKYFSEAKTREEVYALKSALKKVIRGVYFRIKTRDFTLNEVAFHFTLGKSPNRYDKTIPQHVRAARMLENKGIFLKKGDVISFIKVKHSKCLNPDSKILEKTNVKPLQLAEKEEVDVDKYHEMLKTTFGQILDSLDIDFDEIIGISKLDSWM